MSSPASLLPTVLLAGLVLIVSPCHAETTAAVDPASPEKMVRSIYTEALVHGQAFTNLQDLVTRCPGRLSGSPALDRALGWAEQKLTTVGPDRVYGQPVMVPHWERGPAEQVYLADSAGAPALTACALGGSSPTPPDGLVAPVIEVKSVEELAALGRSQLAGKIVFFNGRMNPTYINPGAAYGESGTQRTHGPAEAVKYGAVGALVRSLTEADDDVPHTGVTAFPAGTPKIPAAALSAMAADRLAEAVAEANLHRTAVRVGMKIHSHWFPDAPSHNVIGEIRGREFPDQVIVFGGHIDCWDIAPGAHDDGAGVVQSIEVLRIFRALGIQPRHTLRCVLFVNEENGGAGAHGYADAARSASEKQVFGLESDSGGFQPHAVSLRNARGDAAERAARWLPLLRPYGLFEFREGDAGYDVTPLFDLGATVGEIRPDSQRYFDIHHTREDSIDKVNPRELELGAGALASLIWLVDAEGL